jgi:predicted acylesterase/phospholipase RssA
MSSKTEANAPVPSARSLNLVCGSGGSRAILGSAGPILACHNAGITNWQTLGGASGGSIPTVMLAGGVHPKDVVRITMEIDFSSLLTRHGSLFQILLAYVMKDRYEVSRPKKGVLGSEKVGEFIDKHVPTWPSNYWTVAAVGHTQWLFTADGIYEYHPCGKVIRISDKPAPVGLAVRASCAVPGIIDAVPFMGKYLFDGALTIDGRCPVRVLKRHFREQAENIIGVDVGDDESKQSRRVRKVWKVVCGANCLPPDEKQPIDAEGVCVITPTVTSFRSLQFNLTLDQKWEAVMSGFAGAVPALQKAGLLEGDRLERANAILQAYEAIRATAVNPGELASATETLVSKHGLY